MEQVQTVNGKAQNLHRRSGDAPALCILPRHRRHDRPTKFGCGRGVSCGACTGQRRRHGGCAPARSRSATSKGPAVVTIEGLFAGRQSSRAEGVARPQCRSVRLLSESAQIMRRRRLLQDTPKPTDQAVSSDAMSRQHLSLCGPHLSSQSRAPFRSAPSGAAEGGHDHDQDTRDHQRSRRRFGPGFGTGRAEASSLQSGCRLRRRTKKFGRRGACRGA
jgi:aerobic-type carbon monoxide dehydrogenase small subunit (CoxS/CutS family)